MFRSGYRTTLVLGVMLFTCATAWSAPPAKSASPIGQSDIAARINGQPVTIGDLDAEILKTNRSLFQKLYTARRAAIDGLLIERILAPEAAKRGISVDALVDEKVAAKMTPVTDDDVKKFYDQNRARMGSKTFNQVSGQIRNYLAGQRKTAAKNSLIAELKRSADVKIMMEPPRSPMVFAANDPVEGPPTAKVTILEFSDFQ